MNTAETGSGDLNIIVNGGTVRVETKQLGKNKHSAEFIPKESGQYTVELEFNSFPIRGKITYILLCCTLPKGRPHLEIVEEVFENYIYRKAYYTWV